MIGTNHTSVNRTHLFKLFETSLSSIAPGLGIELFVLQATKAEPLPQVQEMLWSSQVTLEEKNVAELLDRIAVKLGGHCINRYLPDEHYWPERSLKPALSLQEITGTQWQVTRPRPLQLLLRPVQIEVTAPIPDYPPMLFRYKGKLHTIKKADGPERIEREWWLEEGAHRDYYYVEDDAGNRYWLFRSGHYSEQGSQWFIHGFFA